MSRLFGTDGVRGVANEELTTELALKLGRAAGAVLGRGRRERVLIGRDTRASGEMLEAALAAGLCASGVDVVRIGVIPTPGVAYLARYLGAGAGAAVTASHNPAPENGIKFFGPDGNKLPDGVEDEIESHIQDPANLPQPVGAGVGRIQERRDLLHHYGQEVRHTLPARLDGMKLVVDCGNGATSVIAGDVLTDLGAEVVMMNDRPTGLNINEGCGAMHPEQVAEKVKEVGADAGVAFDGDGDRAILADDAGRVVDGDRIMAICALHWSGTFHLPGNRVVGTVMSNLGLELALQSAGIEFLRAPVGDRYVSEEMRRVGASLGGEKSGHIIFAQHSTTGDGLISLMQVLGIMRATRRPLSELSDQVQEFPQILVNVRVSRKEGWSQIPAISTAIKRAEDALADRGRVFVRPSGTEALLRIMAEGPDQAEIERLVGDIREVVERELGKA
ncbi:MAG: phosphoglucosamine mutase [Armatimonadetes bacterium]|nr:phosphoglucosamine mutase [Armatimonadota bacterium]